MLPTWQGAKPLTAMEYSQSYLFTGCSTPFCTVLNASHRTYFHKTGADGWRRDSGIPGVGAVHKSTVKKVALNYRAIADDPAGWKKNATNRGLKLDREGAWCELSSHATFESFFLQHAA